MGRRACSSSDGLFGAGVEGPAIVSALLTAVLGCCADIGAGRHCVGQLGGVAMALSADGTGGSVEEGGNVAQAVVLLEQAGHGHAVFGLELLVSPWDRLHLLTLRVLQVLHFSFESARLVWSVASFVEINDVGFTLVCVTNIRSSACISSVAIFGVYHCIVRNNNLRLSIYFSCLVFSSCNPIVLDAVWIFPSWNRSYPLFAHRLDYFYTTFVLTVWSWFRACC